MRLIERDCAEIVYRNRPISRKVVYVEENNDGTLRCNFYGKGKQLVLMEQIENNHVPYCGKCNARLSDDYLNYCPNCGVKMDNVGDAYAINSREGYDIYCSDSQKECVTL